MTRPGLSRRLMILAAFAWLPLGVPAEAQNVALNRVGSGARAAGMANTFVGVSDDGTAASWNPAGLAQLRKPELSLVQSSERRQAEFEGYGYAGGDQFATMRDHYTLSSIEFASLAVPVELFGKAVTFQVDWRRLYPLGVNVDLAGTRYPAGGGDRIPTSLQILVDGNIDVWSAAGAVRLSRRLAIGLSVGFLRGGWDQRNTWTETTPDGKGTDFVMAHETQQMRGTGATAGLLLSYPAWSVGAVFHAPFDTRYRRNGTLTSNLVAPEEAVVGDARVRLPSSLALGVAWRPGGAWTVAADVTHERWSKALLDQCEVTSPHGEVAECTVRGVNFLDGEPPERTAARDTLALNLGAEHLFPGEGWVIPLRFGVGYEPQAFRDPIVRDGGEYLMLALGSGYNTNSLKLDAAVQYRRVSLGGSQQLGPRTLLEDLPPATGLDHFTDWRIKVSLIYRIADTAKLRGLFRSLFVG